MASVGAVSGLVSGLDTQTIITQLLQVDALPQQALQTKKSDVDSAEAAWKDIAARIANIRTAATAVTDAVARNTMASTSSNTGIAGVTVSTTTTPSAGSFTFQVSQLASAGQVASTGFPSASAPIAPAAGTFVIGSGLTALGIAHVHAGDLPAGAHTITVGQASTAASLSGTQLASASVVVPPNGADLSVTVNGAVVTAHLTAGTYTAGQLATALTTGFGGGVQAVVADGALSLRTTADGASQSLSGINGTAAALLGLDAATGSATGSNASVSVDGGAATSVDPSAGGTVSVSGNTLALSGGHMAAGTARLQVLAVAAGSSLTDLVAQVNAAGTAAGSAAAAADATGKTPNAPTFTATTLDTGSGTTPVRLVLNATGTGGGNDVSFDSDLAGLGTSVTLRKATDAVLTVGSGANAVTITRGSNTVSDAIKGVSLNLLQAAPGTDVTVTTAPDDNGLVSKVQAMVSAYNSLATAMTRYTSYTPGATATSAGTAGTLLGDSQAAALLSSLRTSLQTMAGGKALSQVGVQVQRDGSYAVDTAALTSALKTNRVATDQLLSTTGAVGAFAKALTSSVGTNGVVSSQTKSLDKQSRDLATQISNWDLKLALLKTQYTTQFTAMETALAGFKSVQSQLTSFTSSLTGTTTG